MRHISGGRAKSESRAIRGRLVKGKKLPIHPSFLLLFAWFVLCGRVGEFFIFAVVVLTHELGHYMLARRLGYKLDSFFLAPYGVSLNYKECAFESGDEVKIALAGPAVNLILATIAISLWWLFPATYSFSHEFVIQSTALALFNLLPAYPLDGGRVFVGLLGRKLTRGKAIKITCVLNFVFSAVFVLLFVVSCFTNFNPSLALVAVFMLAGSLDSKFESRYQKYNVFKKKIKNFSKIRSLVVNDSVTLGELVKAIEPNRFTVFYVVGHQKTRALDEGTALKLALIFPLSLQLAEILKNVKNGISCG